jgi:hypothetical protein
MRYAKVFQSKLRYTRRRRKKELHQPPPHPIFKRHPLKLERNPGPQDTLLYS